MSVKGHLALLVGVFVVALAAVTLVQRNLVGDLGDVVRDVGPPAGSRPFTPEGQDAARYR
jgi:hypothetical protein